MLILTKYVMLTEYCLPLIEECCHNSIQVNIAGYGVVHAEAQSAHFHFSIYQSIFNFSRSSVNSYHTIIYSTSVHAWTTVSAENTCAHAYSYTNLLLI